jgi:hypothetical protein
MGVRQWYCSAQHKRSIKVIRVCEPCVSCVSPCVRARRSCGAGTLDFGMVVRFFKVIRVPVCPRVSRVNVNTTDATTGATALLLPAPCVSRVCPGSLGVIFPVTFYR